MELSEIIQKITQEVISNLAKIEKNGELKGLIVVKDEEKWAEFLRKLPQILPKNFKTYLFTKEKSKFTNEEIKNFEFFLFLNPSSSLKEAIAKEIFSFSGCTAKTSECSGCGLCVEKISKEVEEIISHGAERIGATIGVNPKKEIARIIDHTLLKPDATKEEIIKLCEEAKENQFASVCVNPSFVSLAASILKETPVKICTVVGFPLGATTTLTKVMETRDAIANGADEIDMVINVGALKAGDYELVKKDIEEVVKASAGKIVKVILECALLSDEEKIKACQLAKEAGADFVKTSTGFGPGGATVKDVALMRETVGKYMGIKAAGGIRDWETAQKMIHAGATRIGASASIHILKGAEVK